MCQFAKLKPSLKTSTGSIPVPSANFFFLKTLIKKAVNPCQILVSGVKKDLTIHKKQFIVCYYKEKRKMPL
jgi:hypothetical protein